MAAVTRNECAPISKSKPARIGSHLLIDHVGIERRLQLAVAPRSVGVSYCEMYSGKRCQTPPFMHFMLPHIIGLEVVMSANLPPVRLAGRTLSYTNHICAFFSSPVEKNKVLMPFFKDGYDQGEKLFHVVDGKLHDDHRCACQQGGINVSAAEKSGQLEIHSWEESYLKDGFFDSNRMMGILQTMLDGTRGHYPRVRVMGHMEWALEPVPGADQIIEYETKLNYFLPQFPDTFVCVYDLNRHSGSAVIDILRTHPMVIIAGVLQENPLYVPPDEFLEELSLRRQNRGATSPIMVA